MIIIKEQDGKIYSYRIPNLPGGVYGFPRLLPPDPTSHQWRTYTYPTVHMKELYCPWFSKKVFEELETDKVYYFADIFAIPQLPEVSPGT